MDLKKVNDFLSSCEFNEISVSSLTRDLLIDMRNGFDKINGQSDEAMIVVPRSVPDKIPENSSAIIIDAGGTNFRSCLVTSDAMGNVSVSDLQKTAMPAIKDRLSKEEFYAAIADNIAHLKNKASRIGFCFSYAMEMNQEGDGKVLVFSKEINAPEVIGTYVGKELKLALEKKGWNTIEKISLVNDTMACLLAGTVQKDSSKYDSYVGFILGTGINNAYIEQKLDSHIVVCECGMYGKIPQSRFDKAVDDCSVNKGKSKLEKMCSGAYMAQVALGMLKAAAEKNMFSEKCGVAITGLESLSMIEIGNFLSGKEASVFSDMVNSLEDEETIKYLLELIIDRSARIVASVLCASIVSTSCGFEENHPVCVVCNGTTFWKTYGLYDKVCSYLSENMKGEWKRHYELKRIDDDITFGTYAAAF